MEREKSSPSLNPERASINPHRRFLENIALAQLLSKTKNTVSIQILLNQVERKFFETHSKGENPLLLSFHRLVGRTTENERLVARCLKKSGVPVGVVSRLRKRSGKRVTSRSFFIVSHYEERARKALAENPEFSWLREQNARREAKRTID